MRCKRAAPGKVLQSLRQTLESAHKNALGGSRAGRGSGHRGNRGGGGAHGGRNTLAPWRRAAAGGGHAGAPPDLPSEAPDGFTADEWKAVRARAEAAKRAKAEAADKKSLLPACPPEGFTVEEWQAIRDKNAAAVTSAAPKPSPQQLLQAAEKAARRHADLAGPRATLHVLRDLQKGLARRAVLEAA